jgi:hypothetical protein
MRACSWRTARGVLLAACLLTEGTVRAGDRELEVMLVDLTPVALRDASETQCINRFAKSMRAEARVRVLAEAEFRKRTKKVADTRPFLGWKAEEVEGARVLDQHTAMDSIVLVDCRPADKQLDVLVVPNPDATVRLRLRARALTDARIATIAESAVRYAWVSFVP